MRQLQCKADKDQIRIGGRESLGIFSAFGTNGGAGGGFLLLQAQKSRQGRQMCFRTQELREKIFLTLVLLTVDYRERIRRERW